MHRLLPMVLSVLLAACATPQTMGLPTAAPRVESFEQLGVDELNQSIEEAARKNEYWACHPIVIALRYMGPWRGRIINIDGQTGPGEAPEALSLTIVRDGFPDDSVRGDWHRFDFRWEQRSVWRLTGIQRARRCWRGEVTDRFIGRPCP